MITFYDSGIGGLTVVSEYLKLVDEPEFRYFADIDFLPLGDKSREKILERVQITARLSFGNSKLLVLACNTASVNTIRELQQNWLPFYYPGKQILSISKPITELLDNQLIEFKAKTLVILCTGATAKSGFYQREFEKIGYKDIVSIECPGLCDLIEELIGIKLVSSQHLDFETIKTVLDKICQNNLESSKINSYLTALNLPVDCNILLACTHYPLIKNLISLVYPQSFVIDPSKFIASRLVKYMRDHPEYL